MKDLDDFLTGDWVTELEELDNATKSQKQQEETKEQQLKERYDHAMDVV